MCMHVCVSAILNVKQSKQKQIKVSHFTLKFYMNIFKKTFMSNSNQIRWAFNLKDWHPTMEDLLQATSCIQCEEKDRLAKFMFREDFNASLIGRLLMRKFVNEMTAIPYASIQFGRDLKGKPYIIENNSGVMVDFNVSHQGSYSVLAGIKMDNQLRSKIGVDVMKIEYSGGKSLDEFFRVMTKNFSQSEWINIKKPGSEKEKLKNFMRHWCLKESYVKNIGVGITINLQKISFSPKDNLEMKEVVTSTILDVNGVRQSNWRFEETLLDQDHVVAVALENPQNFIDSPPSFQMISFHELMKSSEPLLERDENYCQKVLAKEYKK